jgi:hypothetical protein
MTPFLSTLLFLLALLTAAILALMFLRLLGRYHNLKAVRGEAIKAALGSRDEVIRQSAGEIAWLRAEHDEMRAQVFRFHHQMRVWRSRARIAENLRFIEQAALAEKEAA